MSADKKVPERTKLVSVYLPFSLIRRVKIRAAERDSTISAFFERALRQYLSPPRATPRCRRSVDRVQRVR